MMNFQLLALSITPCNSVNLALYIIKISLSVTCEFRIMVNDPSYP